MTLAVSQLDFGLLRDVSLTVSPGEVLCISGPSGSGKSRLLRALADLDPHCGTVCLNGRSQSQLFAHQWRAEVMMVPADSAWWDRTVGAHFPDTPAVQDLEALGLDPRVMDWEVARLSSGEKQRLALLRALARRPRALLLDEPTANLDPTTTRQTERWLLEQIRHRDLPTLWVAHDPEQIDRVANQHQVIRGDRLEPA